MGDSFLCTPNKLRIFFLAIPWKKMGTRRVAGKGNPYGEGFLSWGSWMDFQRGMNSEAPGIVHTTFGSVCFLA